jgi:hypothetical protein
MGSIHERRYVQVPLACAPGYLSSYIRDVESDGEGRIVLSVKLPLERIGFNRCIEVSKAVAVRFAPLALPRKLKHLTEISWVPVGGGPFPDFNGTIGVEAGEGDDSCCLALGGNYDPPLGVIGDAFDAIIGKNIARLTARNLLDEIAIMMESAHSQGLSSASARPPSPRQASVSPRTNAK